MLQRLTRSSPTPTATAVPVKTSRETDLWSTDVLTLSGFVFCQDTQALCVLERALDRLNVETTLALSSEDAHEQISGAKLDVAIVDFEESRPANTIVRALRTSAMNRNCTVIAIASDGRRHQEAFKSGANFTIPRVHTADAAMRCLRSSHFLTLRNKRGSVRLPLDDIVTIYRNGESPISAAIKNLSETGLRVKCSAKLMEGEILEFDFKLPNGHINAKARVVHLNGNGDAGCLFTTMDPATLKTVQEWINTKLMGHLQ